MMYCDIGTVEDGHCCIDCVGIEEKNHHPNTSVLQFVLQFHIVSIQSRYYNDKNGVYIASLIGGKPLVIRIALDPVAMWLLCVLFW